LTDKIDTESGSNPYSFAIFNASSRYLIVIPPVTIPNPPDFFDRFKEFNRSLSIISAALANRLIKSRCCFMHTAAPALVKRSISRIRSGSACETGAGSMISASANAFDNEVVRRINTGP